SHTSSPSSAAHRLTLPRLFFSNPPPPTPLSTLSLHDALPILADVVQDLAPHRRHDHGPDLVLGGRARVTADGHHLQVPQPPVRRSEEHTSELQSLTNIVCRLLLEKKKQQPLAQHLHCRPPHHH